MRMVAGHELVSEHARVPIRLSEEFAFVPGPDDVVKQGNSIGTVAAFRLHNTYFLRPDDNLATPARLCTHVDGTWTEGKLFVEDGSFEDGSLHYKPALLDKEEKGTLAAHTDGSAYHVLNGVHLVWGHCR